MTPWRADDLLARARSRIERVEPEDLERLHQQGALVVDIRPEHQRRADGDLPFAVVVERNVLEWRLDLLGDHALPQIRGYDQQVIVVCDEGYASSLAAASLCDLGYADAADLVGGYQAWRAATRGSGWNGPAALETAAPVRGRSVRG